MFNFNCNCNIKLVLDVETLLNVVYKITAVINVELEKKYDRLIKKMKFKDMNFCKKCIKNANIF